MSKNFIKHGNSTIKLSAITGVSWETARSKLGSVRYPGYGRNSSRRYCSKSVIHLASVTIKTGEHVADASYDSDALAEAAYDEIVAKWEDA